MVGGFRKGFGVALIILGVLGLLAGLVVAIGGSVAADVQGESERERNGDGAPLLGDGGKDRRSQETQAKRTAEALAVGGVLAGGGALVLLVGVVFSVWGGRAAHRQLAERVAALEQNPTRKA